MDYFKIDALSCSELKDFMRSGEFYLYQKEFPREKTDALMFGDAYHKAILEPDLFEKEVCFSPKCDRRTKEGKSTHETFLRENEGKVILNYDDFNTIQRMQKKLIAQFDFKNFRKEFVVQSCYEDVNIKSKIDAYDSETKTIYDLKTTEDALNFLPSIYKYKYWLQAAFYMLNCNNAGIEVEQFVFVVQEKVRTNDFMFYKLNNGCLSESIQIVHNAILKFKNSFFEGYLKTVQEIELNLEKIKNWSEE